MEVTELRQTRELHVGDTLVNSVDRTYEVTKITRVGRGIRVQYLTPDGQPGRFTAAPDAVSRVRVGHAPFVAA